MSKSGKITKGPFWSQNWFEAMWHFTCNNFVNFDTGAVDFEALGREEYEFRKALFFRNFKNSKRARTVFDEAKAEYDKKVENGMKGGRPKKNTECAANGNAGVDRKSATSCGQFTADGDTREDSNDGKSGTSANIYGDAARREAADGESDGNVVSYRATVSKPLALDMPRPDKASDPSGHNTGNVPPSHGHEDGNLYDKETIGIRTNDKRTGGQSPLSQYPSSRPPVRDRRVSGDVMSLAYSGEFGNVRLTQEQYAELGIRFGNQQKLNRAIDSLSCQVENGEKNPPNHYAELVKWANYRDDMEEKEELKASSTPHYETVSEHNARIVRESDKWIDEYYAQKRKAANGK